MNINTYHFDFEPHIDMDDVRSTLLTAIVAIGGVVGSARLHLCMNYSLDEAERTLQLEVEGGVGAVLVQAFTSLLCHEYGNDAFTVARSGIEPTRLETAA